jgi:hypothetical protein
VVDVCVWTLNNFTKNIVKSRRVRRGNCVEEIWHSHDPLPRFGQWSFEPTILLGRANIDARFLEEGNKGRLQKTSQDSEPRCAVTRSARYRKP